MQKKNGCLQGVLLVASALAVMFLIGFMSLSAPIKGQVPLYLIVLIIVSAAEVCLLVHELGHIFAGVLAGMRFLSLYVWPFRVTHFRRGWSFGLERAGQPLDGQGLAFPVDAKDVRKRYLIHYFGGPAAGLITTIAAAGLLLHREHSQSSAVGLFLFMYAFVGLSLNIGALLPAVRHSDGAGILRLARGGQLGEKFGAYLAITMQAMHGMFYDEMDESLRVKLVAPAELPPPFDRIAVHHAYYWSLASKDIEAARRQLDAMRSLADRPENAEMCPWVALEQAYFAARHDRDPEEQKREHEGTQNARADPAAGKNHAPSLRGAGHGSR